MSAIYVVNLLWSGGWDSTYRLLHLVLTRRKTVQPHYIIDPDRLSTRFEIHAMRNIKLHLFAKYAWTKTLLLPTIFTGLDDIRADKEITDCNERVLLDYRLGPQYGWLANYAVEHGIKDLELCIDKGPGDLDRLLRPLLVLVDVDNEMSYEMNRDEQDKLAGVVFRYFKFPLFDTTKLDMERLSKEEGFYDLMLITWFCHRPRPNGTPCGTCSPCAYTIKRGLGRRISCISRIRYRLSRAAKIAGLVKKNTNLHNFFKK
jgi:hypothetical protein